MKKFNVIEKSRFLEDETLNQVKGGNLPPCTPYYCNEEGYAVTPPCAIGAYNECPTHFPCGNPSKPDTSYFTCIIPDEYNFRPCYHQLCIKNLQE